MQCFKVLVPLALLCVVAADNWAVIIAGSKSFANYRHQADACHAYQIVIRNGIPESNVILMMYDDIANAAENPFPGKIFNKPTKAGEDGFDVYKGCKPDYVGKNVTAEKFLAVLTGDAATAGGKVLKSTSSDKVFINFADHGGAGIICMPDDKNLYAKDLNKALTTMHSQKMYERLVFYLEACESGSMFEKLLPANMNIYATTAANGKESSWGTYCPPQDKVNGKSVGSCLGDLYSVNWMEDSDQKAEQASETLKQQYGLVLKETNKSHVQEFGDTSMGSDMIHLYQGSASMLVRPIDLGRNRSAEEAAADQALKESSAVDSRDIQLVHKFYQYMRADAGQRAEQAQALVDEIEHRERSDTIFAKLTAAVSGDSSGTLLSAYMPLSDHDCQKEALEAVAAACGTFSDYSLKYTRAVVNLCESGHAAATIGATARALCA